MRRIGEDVQKEKCRRSMVRLIATKGEHSLLPQTMNSMLQVIVVAILPLTLSQDYEEVPYCKNGGKALMEDVISHTIDSINKNVRYRLEKGTQLNGPTTSGPKFLPKAKKLGDLKWSCDLELEAMKLLGDKCLEAAPAAPAGKTGLFFKFDDEEDLSYATAISAWLEEIDNAPLSDAATAGPAVTYQGDAKTANFANLIREDITEIACAQAHCKQGGEKYRAFCLLNKPPLKKGDVLYQKA